MRHLFVYGTLRWCLLPEPYRPRCAPGVAPPSAQFVGAPLWNEENFPGLLQAVMQKLSYAGTGQVWGRLYDLGPYPGAVLEKDAGSVITGDVYYLPPDPAVLVSLDAYEDYDARYPERSLFRRVPVSVTMLGGQHLDCWIYVYNGDISRARLIPDGDYLQYRRWNFAVATP
ncbi:MAG: gamma-glutamylcyclotransferase family protein [Gemmatales bacterium]|nr:gamma-glutamylcyclotransferase [Gemmatales bacterium]MDW7993187.1 gamma-glutamylcyclotransferase family protein [Gemmatales bacterium]